MKISKKHIVRIKIILLKILRTIFLKFDFLVINWRKTVIIDELLLCNKQIELYLLQIIKTYFGHILISC
jgi:hypothetical protein